MYVIVTKSQKVARVQTLQKTNKCAKNNCRNTKAIENLKFSNKIFVVMVEIDFGIVYQIS